MELSFGNELLGLFVLRVGEVRPQEKVEDSNLKSLVFPQSGSLSNGQELADSSLSVCVDKVIEKTSRLKLNQTALKLIRASDVEPYLASKLVHCPSVPRAN